VELDARRVFDSEELNVEASPGNVADVVEADLSFDARSLEVRIGDGDVEPDVIEDFGGLVAYVTTELGVEFEENWLKCVAVRLACMVEKHLTSLYTESISVRMSEVNKGPMVE